VMSRGHLGQLPSEIHRILHTDIEALSTLGGMYVRGVAREQYTPSAVGRCLSGHVGKAGDPRRAVHPMVGPVDENKCLADVLQGGLAGVFEVLFGQDDPY